MDTDGLQMVIIEIQDQVIEIELGQEVNYVELLETMDLILIQHQVQLTALTLKIGMKVSCMQ